MGIDFSIGQAYINTEYGEVSIDIEEVEKVVIDGIENGKQWSNCFGMSYSTFDEFINMTPANKELFSVLAPKHPAKVLLKPDHLVQIDSAIAFYRERYPQSKPKFAKELKEGDEGFDKFDPSTWWANDATLEDAHLARLVRFRYWINWALENCSIPTFYNW